MELTLSVAREGCGMEEDAVEADSARAGEGSSDAKLTEQERLAERAGGFRLGLLRAGLPA